MFLLLPVSVTCTFLCPLFGSIYPCTSCSTILILRRACDNRTNLYRYHMYRAHSARALSPSVYCLHVHCMMRTTLKHIVFCLCTCPDQLTSSKSRYRQRITPHVINLRRVRSRRQGHGSRVVYSRWIDFRLRILHATSRDSGTYVFRVTTPGGDIAYQLIHVDLTDH